MIISILSKSGPEYSIFVSTFHATGISILNWKMSSLSTLFDSLTKEQDKLICMGALRSSKGKGHARIVQGSNNTKSKEKQIVKEKKSKLDNEDENLKPTYEGSMKKVKKKWSTYKCSYCIKGINSENKCFKKNMDIMSQLLEKHNIEVLDELEKSIESLEHSHIPQFQGDINYALSTKVKSFPHISNIDLISDISES